MLPLVGLLVWASCLGFLFEITKRAILGYVPAPFPARIHFRLVQTKKRPTDASLILTSVGRILVAPDFVIVSPQNSSSKSLAVF